MNPLTRLCLILFVLGTGSPPAMSAEGRADLNWWAFQIVERPAPPASSPAVHPIDAFVRDRLSREGMEPAPPADPETLVKRLHYDLTGLSPSEETMAEFARQADNASMEKLVDHLLESHHFGERWARHWLDVVRFAETNGYERDAVKPNIWKYRDWVIRAFNEDMPYDQFVRQQLAGDEISHPTEQSVIATGMLRAATWNDEPNDPQDYKYERLEDLVDVVGTAFLGLTVKCARCHDHKFDPIPQRDYYRFAAAFWPGPIEPRARELMGGPTAEELGYKDVFGWTDLHRSPSDFHLLIKGDPGRPGASVAPGHLSLVPWLDTPLHAPAPESKTTQRRLQMAAFLVDRSNPLTARVLVNRLWQHLLGRGLVGTPNNFGFKSEPPSHPALLDWLAADFMEGGWKIKRMIRQIVLSETYRQASIHPHESTYGVKDSGNRLYWKMNRRRKDAEVLRDHMLQASAELNLKSGGPSFYPELAPEVLEGFSRKSSAWAPSPESERRRRSIYMMTKRHLLVPLMTAFDFPNSEKPCGKRDVTIVAPQALALLNNHFVHQRSEALARTLRALAPDATIAEAWQKALGRPPSLSEHASCHAHLAEQEQHFRQQGSEYQEARFLSLASLCHLLLNTNEFAYVD